MAFVKEIYSTPSNLQEFYIKNEHALFYKGLNYKNIYSGVYLFFFTITSAF
jgi:hypothetical protein